MGKAVRKATKRMLAFILAMGLTFGMVGSDLTVITARANQPENVSVNVDETVSGNDVKTVSGNENEPVEESSEAEADTQETENPTEDEVQAVSGNTTGTYYLCADENGYLTVSGNTANFKQLSGDVEIPKEVKIIPADSRFFMGNTSVSAVTFEEGSLLETIEDNAFNRSVITEITLPEALHTVGNKAFDSAKLKKVTMAYSDTKVTLGEAAFAGCDELKTFIGNARVEVIGKQAFYDNKKLGETIDLSGVSVIGQEAFAGCKALKYLSIPDSVTEIGAQAFANCTGLGTSSRAVLQGKYAVKIGDGLTTLSEKTFMGCSGLTEMELPASITKIENSIFDNCTALKSIIVKNRDGENGSCATVLSYYSFPAKNGLVLNAFDGTVEEWVGTHTSFGVKFKTLYKSHAITVDSKMKNGTITPKVKQAKVGTVVELTITPAQGYVVDRNAFYYVYDEEKPPIEIDIWENSFEMPDSPVTIYAKFIKASTIPYGDELVVDSEKEFDDKIKSNEKIDYDSKSNTVKFPKPWQYARIIIEDNNEREPGYGELAFVAKDTNVVTVDEKGVITAVAPGKTEITVSLTDTTKTTKPLTFNVEVGARTYVDTVAVEYNAPKGTVAYKADDAEADELGYDVITFSSNIVNVASRSITVTPTCIDEAGDQLFVKYSWSSMDNSVAKPKSSVTTEKTATITIPKGAIGETVITMKVQDGKKEPKLHKFIVRVVDDTPRLLTPNLKVDRAASKGAKVELLSVYGSEIDESTLKLCKKKITTAGTTFEEASKDFKLEKKDGTRYLVCVNEKFGKDAKHTFMEMYYICGNIQDTEAEFQIMIPKIEVYKSNLSPSAKLTGKINLFYNGLADDAAAGKVYVKQNQKDLTIEEVSLVGIKKSNGENTDDDSAFANNFSIEPSDDAKYDFVIKRTENDMQTYTAGKSKGKNVLEGILRLKYAEYAEAYDIKIKISVETKAPSYVPSISTIKVNKNAFGQTYEVQLLEKKTKAALDMVEGTELAIDNTEKGTTDGLINDNRVIASLDTVTDSFDIVIESATSGKIVFSYKQPGWTKELKATIKVNATSSFPTAKLGKKTLTLNAKCPQATESTTLVLNQTDSFLEDIQTFAPTGSKRDADLKVIYEDGKVTAKIVNEQDGTVAKGSYKFECVPQFMFMGADTADAAKKVTLTVKVIDTVPEIKLKSTTFTLNASFPQGGKHTEYDEAVQTYTWKNLPSEYAGYDLNTDDMTLTFKGKGTDRINANNINLVFDNDAKDVTVSVETAGIREGSGTYEVSGLYLENNNGDKVPVKAFKVTVKNQLKTPAVSVSAKGTINPLDRESAVIYTPKLTYINGGISDVKVCELMPETGASIAEEDAHFEAEMINGKTYVRVKDGVNLENRSYTIQLYYRLTNAYSTTNKEGYEGYYKVKKDIKITPKQVMPKVKAENNKAVFYAGNKSVTATTKLTQTSQLNADIIEVKIADKAPAALKNAFKCEYNPATKEVTLRLKNSAFIKQNAEQTLQLEIVCDGQLENTVGTTFDMKVTVKK